MLKWNPLISVKHKYYLVVGKCISKLFNMLLRELIERIVF